MVSGDMIKRTITIIEGWTLKDIEKYLEVEELDPVLEGYLFPDTYELFYNDGLDEIIEKMLANFDKKTKEKIVQLNFFYTYLYGKDTAGAQPVSYPCYITECAPTASLAVNLL